MLTWNLQYCRFIKKISTLIPLKCTKTFWFVVSWFIINGKLWTEISDNVVLNGSIECRISINIFAWKIVLTLSLPYNYTTNYTKHKYLSNAGNYISEISVTWKTFWFILHDVPYTTRKCFNFKNFSFGSNSVCRIISAISFRVSEWISTPTVQIN